MSNPVTPDLVGVKGEDQTTIATVGNPLPVRTQAEPEVFEFKDRITVGDVSLVVANAEPLAESREVTVHVPWDQPNYVHINAGSDATRLKSRIHPGGTWRGVTKQAISLIAGGQTSGGVGTVTTPDESPFNHDGELVGTTKPALVASPWAGFNQALDFDGVDLDDLSAGVNLGDSPDFGLRGETGSSFEADMRALGPDSLWRMNETSGDMLDQMPAQPYKPKALLLTTPQSWWDFDAEDATASDTVGAVHGTRTAGSSASTPTLVTPAQAEGRAATLLTAGTVYNFGAAAYRFAGTQAFSVGMVVKMVGAGCELVLGNGVVDIPTATGWDVAVSRSPTPSSNYLRMRRFSGPGTIAEYFLPPTFDFTKPMHLVFKYIPGASARLAIMLDGICVATIVDPTSLVASAADLTLSVSGGDVELQHLWVSTSITTAVALSGWDTHAGPLYTYGTSKIGACHGVVSGSVTRNAPALVEVHQNNPFNDANGALQFSNVDAFVNFGAEAYRLLGLQPFTVVRRFKFAVGSVRNQLYRSNGAANQPATGDGFAANITGTGGGGTRTLELGRAGNTGTTTVPDDGLAHSYVGVFDGSTLTVYADGVAGLPVASTSPMTAATGFMHLGENAGSGVVDNEQDEMAIFLRALTAEEIAALHTSATVWDGKYPKTFDIRFRADTFDPAGANTVVGRVTPGNRDWRLQVESGTPQLLFYGSGGVSNFNMGVVAVATNYVFRFVDDRTYVIGYLNGVEKFRAAQRFGDDSTDGYVTQVGSRPASTNPAVWDGIIDEFRVSKSVRTDDGSVPYTVDADTLALLHFDSIADSGAAPAAPTVDVEVYVGEPE